MAAGWVYSHNFTLYWGDAEAHLDIARRIVESRNPGYLQLGSPWLPLPHLLMLPLVIHDWLWQSGLAGVIPNAFCFTAAAGFLFAATRRLFNVPAAWCAASLFVLNPNALYLQSIPMTEAVFFAATLGVLFFTTRYRVTQSVFDLAGAAIMCLAATLTRYEGWIFVPAVTAYVFIVSLRARLTRSLVFGAGASAGAAWWLFYNWQLNGNALDFYNGPNSAMAIQLGMPYPGHGDWKVALHYFLTATKLVTGWPLLWAGGTGLLAAWAQRAFWPVTFLALWPLFIVWSMHSAAQPIHIPPLPPFSWYNTRYALSMLPLLAFGAGAMAGAARYLRGGWGAVLVAASFAPAAFWLFHPSHENWITWKESEQNSIARRAWTHAAAEYLKVHARPTDTFFTTFGDITAIYREDGIHFKRTLTWDDFPEWYAAVNRPDLFLWEDWAVAQCGDAVDRAVQRAREVGVEYDLITEIKAPGGEPIEIYRRHEYPLH